MSAAATAAGYLYASGFLHDKQRKKRNSNTNQEKSEESTPEVVETPKVTYKPTRRTLTRE